MTDPIALIDVTAHRARIGPEIDRRIAAVVEHGRWIMGPEVREFEEAVEARLGPGVHAVGCGNGTDALVLAFHALGLQPGQAVICPSFTFVATAEAVVNLGGVPVFADVEDGGFNLDVESVEAAHAAATEAGLSVVGICAVDLFGVPADAAGLSALAERLGCWLVADAAQSFGGATSEGQVGAITQVATTSFFPTKPLACYGDGGLVTTTDEGLADTVRSLRVHGKGTHKYDNVRVGYNSRLDTMQAAILLARLGILDDELELRQAVADRYEKGLALVANPVEAPTVAGDKRSAWAQYTIVTDHRSAIQQELSARQIGSAIYYPVPLHGQSAYRHFELPGVDLSRTDQLCGQVLSLPMHPYLTDDQIDRVIDAVGSAETSAPTAD
jgi:dTDP-4-amino-4,6-dideoxygalactose transaminase